MFSIFNSSKRIIRTINVQSRWRAYHRKQFIIQCDFFDTHPIDRQAIDALTKLDSDRKSRASVKIVRDLFTKYENETNAHRKNELAMELRNEFKKFPNQTHPTVLAYGANAANTEIECHGDAHNTENPDGKDYVTICKLLNTVRLEQLGNFTGSRSYYFMYSIAELVSHDLVLGFTH